MFRLKVLENILCIFVARKDALKQKSDKIKAAMRYLCFSIIRLRTTLKSRKQSTKQKSEVTGIAPKSKRNT